MDIAAVKALAARHDSEEAEEFLDALEDGDEERARIAARDFMNTIQRAGRLCARFLPMAAIPFRMCYSVCSFILHASRYAPGNCERALILLPDHAFGKDVASFP